MEKLTFGLAQPLQLPKTVLPRTLMNEARHAPV
jgi:hypothetical protein